MPTDRARAPLSWERFLSLSYNDGQNQQCIFQSISSFVYLVQLRSQTSVFQGRKNANTVPRDQSITSDGARKYILTTKFDLKDKKPLLTSFRGHGLLVERYGNIRYNPESPTLLSVLVEALQFGARNGSQPTTKATYWMIMDTVPGRGLKQYVYCPALCIQWIVMKSGDSRR